MNAPIRAAISRLTSKNQTTIPREVRSHLNLKPGDSVRYEDDGRGGIRMVKAAGWEDLVGIVEVDPDVAEALRGKTWDEIRNGTWDEVARIRMDEIDGN